MSEANPNRMVWAEFPAINVKRATGFYEELLQSKLVEDNNGPQPIYMLFGNGEEAPFAHMYEGKPATAGDGVTPHLDLKCEHPEAMERVKKGGGEVVSDVITIPAGSFFYAKDTEGNSLSIFKYNG